MLIRTKHSMTATQEFNMQLRRILPWDKAPVPVGSAWGVLAPQESTPPDQHLEEHEAFFILSGTGQLTVDSDTRSVAMGDFIYLPAGSHHQLRNASTSHELNLLMIYWPADVGVQAGTSGARK